MSRDIRAACERQMRNTAPGSIRSSSAISGWVRSCYNASRTMWSARHTAAYRPGRDIAPPVGTARRGLASDLFGGLAEDCLAHRLAQGDDFGLATIKPFTAVCAVTALSPLQRVVA